jgi:hypothetical protein
MRRNQDGLEALLIGDASAERHGGNGWPNYAHDVLRGDFHGQ